MWQKITLVCAVLLFMASWAFAQDAVLEFEGRYWMPDLTAKVKVVESGIGTSVNFKSDLGVENENFPEGRLIWNIGPNSKVRLFYTQAKFEGDKTITQDIAFNGKTYSASTRVNSKLDLQYFGLGWIWEFINTPNDKFKLGTVLDLKGIAGKAALDATGINESASFIAGLPAVGLVFDISPFKETTPYKKEEIWKNFSIYGEISGMSAGKYGYFFDTEAGLKFVPYKCCSITGGYRVVSLKAQNTPDYAKIELKGPFVGATIRF